MFRIALSLLAAFFLSGCFVIDEINKGDALIEKHSVGWRNKKAQKLKEEQEEAAKAPPPKELPFKSWSEVKGKAQQLWQAALEEEAAPVDPNNTVIPCEIGGRVHFLRKSDCTIRGGRAKTRSATR